MAAKTQTETLQTASAVNSETTPEGNEDFLFSKGILYLGKQFREEEVVIIGFGSHEWVVSIMTRRLPLLRQPVDCGGDEVQVLV